MQRWFGFWFSCFPDILKKERYKYIYTSSIHYGFSYGLIPGSCKLFLGDEEFPIWWISFTFNWTTISINFNDRWKGLKSLHVFLWSIWNLELWLTSKHESIKNKRLSWLEGGDSDMEGRWWERRKFSVWWRLMKCGINHHFNKYQWWINGESFEIEFSEKKNRDIRRILKD